MTAFLGADPEALIRAALARGGDFCDLFRERTATTSVVCEEDRIEHVTAGRDEGLGIRVLSGFHTAHAATNSRDAAHLLALARETGAIAHGAPRDVTLSGASRRVHPLPFPVARPPDGVSLEEKVALVSRVNRIARGLDPRVRQVRVQYADRLQDIEIVNSEGLRVSDTRLSVLLAIHVVVSDGERLQTAYEPAGAFAGFEFIEESDPEEMARRAVSRALMMLSARPAPAGVMPVVLSSSAGGTMIHEAVGHGLEADLAREGLSVYSGRIGEQVASPLVTVLDDATLPHRRGSFSVDDEGTPAERTVLIEGGVLQAFMYDRLSAAKFGAASTGNGRRESFRSRPICRMTNTLIAPGTDDPAAILADTPRGLLVTRMGGGQVDTVNGNFVFEVTEGYLIENGARGEPVRGATLTGNGPQVLLAIDRVGTDLGFAIGTCGKDGQGAPVSDAQPTLRIPEMVVGGENR